MKNLKIAAATLLSGFIAVPLAAQATMTFESYGVAMPVGETLVTDFSTSQNLTGGTLVTGSTSDLTAAPAYSATTFDTAQYLSVPGGQSATLTFAPTKEISVYAGSIDAYNTLSFGGAGGLTYTGSQMGAVSGGDNGDQTGPNTNGRFVFTFAKPVDSATFSSTSNAFEVASVASVAAVPEPASWALMIVGFGGLGGTLRASRRRPVSAVI